MAKMKLAAITQPEYYPGPALRPIDTQTVLTCQTHQEQLQGQTPDAHVLGPGPKPSPNPIAP